MELTEEIINKSLNSNMFVLFLFPTVLLLIGILLLVISFRMRKQRRELIKANIGQQREIVLYRKNAKGLLIASVILTVLAVLFCCLFYFVSNRDWHIEISEISDCTEKMYMDNDILKTKHYVRVSGFDEEIYVTEFKADTIEEGDEVYVLVLGKDDAVDVWSKKIYYYNGDKLY